MSYSMNFGFYGAQMVAKISQLLVSIINETLNSNANEQLKEKMS